MAPTPEQIAAATRIIRGLTGKRWVWPPVRVVERYPGGTGVVLLRGRIVRAVNSVTRVETSEPIEHTVFLGGRVELNGHADHCQSDEVEVDYEFGSKPPIVAQNAIDTLAAEFEKLVSDGKCRLPDRVTSISRQGTSWNMVDPNDILDKGRTGIYEIDLAMRAVTSVRSKAAIFSPEYPPPKRVSIERLPEPAEEPPP